MMLLPVHKHQKKIAFLFLTIFYLDIITPGIAAAASARKDYPYTFKDHSNYGVSAFASDPGPGNFLPASKEVKEGSVNLVNVNEKIRYTNEAVPGIGGPDQPEMKSFQSVNANNMVDLFTGDFSYSIPLLDVGGYPVNLHYSSGISMDQEASWVGLGWNINPGSISRSMRGLPDDFDGINDSLRRTQHIKENRTTGVTIEPSLEIVGTPLNVSARMGIFYNSYNGYGLETGVGIGGTAKTAFGSLTGNLSISNNSQEGIRISPSLSVGLGKAASENNLQGSLGISTGYSSRGGISSLQINGGTQSDRLTYQKNALMSTSVSYPLASISFATPSYSPSINMPIRNRAFSFTGKIGGEVWGVDASAAFTGYVNTQDIADEDTTQKIPAAGYLYSTNANNREDVLLDFNREKDMEFNYKSTPHIALPQYTYDAFSISGEGTGGSFRPYRGDVGYVFDHSVTTRSSSTNGSIDVGLGAAVHVGLEITNITTSNANHRWNKSNSLESKLRFQSADSSYEAVYFRNPGEKTTNAQNYYRAIGDDSLVRIKLSGSKDNVRAESALVKYDDEGRPHSELPVTEGLIKKERDKRTQSISYFTAEDASILGLDKTIRSYKENSIPLGLCQDSIKVIPRVDNTIRKKNHLSEISVLNSDGRKYVYGLPIYNVEQKDVTFAVSKETNSDNLDKGLVQYSPGSDNTTRNTKGKDNYFSRDEMPAYAHNFLLTGIVSPDYVDITGNGISEDDPGDAVKFNYTQVYGADNGYYMWRAPYQENKANYNEGFKTYNRDDKGTYLFGKKEMWYLNSVESKTMIAVFQVANDRQDVYSVQGENGGINSGKAARRLKRIDLYVKADLIKNGISKARPIKSVHFDYSYDLCKGTAGNSSTGKLTLKRVWFTYNKNNKGQRNPYVFQYNPDANGLPQPEYNPAFNSRYADRWGMFKNPSDNPDGMSNADFPYSLQDSVKAAKYAAAWNLTDIQLPSGGRMHVTYESDDYAYVQDKRATQMFTIAGINQPGQMNLYNSSTKEDYYTIYINTTEALKSKADIRNKYLALEDVLYFKLAVSMPSDQFGGGTEMIPGYGKIQDYGISAGNDHQFWIRLASVENRSPMSRAALQFLRLNLRSKAYPGSEGIDNIGLQELIKMMATSISELSNMIMSFDGAAKSKGICNQVNLDRSFVRLSSPRFKKYGGGYRVKRVEIFDNWKKMTNQKESVYGQEYNYTTSEDIDGQMVITSSGVATYEPAIGGEENPFRRPINYSEKVAPLGPVNFMFSEEPIGESFFASPMVGYRRVRVRTINAKSRSANGWEETEYFTSRDFPTIVEHTLLEAGSSKFKYETKSNILRLNHKNIATLSQGFRIELNDMNGKIKAQSTYAETDSLNPIKYSLSFYKVDDDKAFQKHLNNQVWVVDSANGHINTQGQIGKDIEVMVDLREQHSKAFTKGFSPNVDVIAPFIPPFIPVLYLPSKVNLPQKEEVRFRSAAVVKIVQRYGILDSIVVMDKGSVVSTKNILYDAETGNVLLSRTNNEFNDPIYNFNYPAYWAYSGMGLAYKNISSVFQSKAGTGGLQMNEGKLYREGSAVPYPAERFFESGDEVYVYNAVKASPGPDCRFLTTQGGNWKGKLWVIDAAKGVEKDKGFYFIDSLGKIPPNMVINKMVIIRSGKRNMPDVSAGSVVMLSNPMKPLTGGKYKIVIDENSRVVNAGTATFKDLWKVENSEYQQDSCYTVMQPQTVYVQPRVNLIKRKFKISNYTYNYFVPQSNLMLASTEIIKRQTDRRTHGYNTKALLEFNHGLPAGSVVTQAVLQLYPREPRNPIPVWPYECVDKNVFGNCVRHNNDWNIEKENWRDVNEHRSIFKRVTAPWVSSPANYDNYVGSNTNSVELVRNSSTSVTITSLVQDIVNTANYGILYQLKNDPAVGSYNFDRIAFLGFSGKEETYSGWCYNPKGGGYSLCNKFVQAPLITINAMVPKDTCIKVCRKYISDTATNPYRWGILGNWRMERAYTYFYDREENNALIKTTNIRQEGTLKEFIPYWSFSTTGIVGNEDTTRWVWNSAISTFNRKGFEIENFDPLDRFNSGLYGYNQTLPVAVAQNSKYRELLYDGFEDYGYKTSYCTTCPNPREFDFIKGNAGVDTTRLQSHTGLYSVKINQGFESLVSVPVTVPTINTDTKLSAAIDSTPVIGEEVIGAGQGIKGTYSMGKKFFGNICTPGGATTIRTDTTINFDWSSQPPVPLGGSDCSKIYRITWTGSIQPRFTDQYRFYLKYNGTASIVVNGINIFSSSAPQSGERVSKPIALQAGRIYPISIVYTKTLNVAHGPVEFRWSSFVSQAKEIVPKRFLYPVNPVPPADTVGSIIRSILYYCVKANTVKPFNVIRSGFSPLKNSKLTVSAWVRLDVVDCNATPALDSVIQVHFNTGGTGATRWLKKTGLRIEGWQRYEVNVTVPTDASTMYLRLKTLANVGIFTDDIRVQPFNSGMKGFVYNPENLRLMAELDENNYASFYEYDDEGTLIRVKKETERGVLMVQETRSALIKE